MDLKLPTEEMESRREWGDGKGEEEMGNVKQEEGETQCPKGLSSFACLFLPSLLNGLVLCTPVGDPPVMSRAGDLSCQVRTRCDSERI